MEREDTGRQVAEGPAALPWGPVAAKPQLFSHLCLVPGPPSARKAHGVTLVTTCDEEMCPLETRNEKTACLKPCGRQVAGWALSLGERPLPGAAAGGKGGAERSPEAPSFLLALFPKTR